MTRIRLTAPEKFKQQRICLPKSKSISNRLLLICALSGKRDVTKMPPGLSDSDDTAVMLRALEGELSHVDVGAAGTSMRFLTAYLATQHGTHYITGSERMKRRPIGLLVEALRSLGAQIEYAENEGFPPLRITGGGLHGGAVSLPGNVSSQYISALMMIGPTLSGGLTIDLEGEIGSRPYIDMTMQVMKQSGAQVCWQSEHCLRIEEGEYNTTQFRVEADWSAASYWYAITALAADATFDLEGLSLDSLQGDSEVASICRPLGVSSAQTANGDICISHTGNSVVVYDMDFTHQPDLAQTFVCLCCAMGIRFRFRGLASLRIKETDRMTALVTELRKLGYAVCSNEKDELRWNGEKVAPSHEPIMTYKDHRMAMAFAPLSIVCGPIEIDEPEVVSKSYPNFWNDLRSVGFKTKEI